MTEQQTLSTLLREKVPTLVVTALKSPALDEEGLKGALVWKLSAVITAIGNAIDRRIDEIMEEKQSKKTSASTRDKTVKALANSLSNKFADAISAELTGDKSILANDDKLAKKLGEIAEGYKQFTEEDLDALAKVQMEAAIKAVSSRKTTEANLEEDKDPDEEKTSRIQAGRTFTDSVTPKANPKPRTPVRDTSSDTSVSYRERDWGGKGGSSSRGWGGK